MRQNPRSNPDDDRPRNALPTSAGRTAWACPLGAWHANRPSTDCCPSAGLRRQRNNDADAADCETDLPSGTLHIEVSHVQRVVFDELPAWLDYIAHQNREHLVGIDRVVVVQIDFEQLALLWI